jgi:predicted benzoate:H+ symporter BenE
LASSSSAYRRHVNVLLTYLTVVLATAVLGAWSIPLGLLLDLPPLGVYLAAVAGSLLVTVLVLTLGGRLRDDPAGA